MVSREKTIVVVGPNSAGKATTIGSILFKYGGVNMLTMQRFLEQGITSYDQATKALKSLDIDLEFDTPKHHVNILDISSGQADCAILVLSANSTARQREITKEVMRAAQQLIILINKMDAIDWSEEQFQKIIEELSQYVVDVPIIPISALHGDNIVEKSSNSPWYKGWENRGQSGMTLLEALDVSL